eukprot:5855306-Amphidinium_carterae.1
MRSPNALQKRHLEAKGGAPEKTSKEHDSDSHPNKFSLLPGLVPRGFKPFVTRSASSTEGTVVAFEAKGAKRLVERIGSVFSM